jgi:hypothetical protein
MAKIPSVSIEVWDQLYGIANRFRDLHPWDWMKDSEIFAVQNPAGDETGYCVVLGALGEVLALCVYRGGHGLAFHQRIASEDHPDTDEFFGNQNQLMAEFVNKTELEAEDKKIIRTLGLRYDGERQYPKFRSYLPGYFPWYLTEGEARFLILAFHCAIDVGENCRRDPHYLQASNEGDYLTYVLAKKGVGANSFSKLWRRPAPIEQPDPTLPPIQTEDLKRKDLREDSVWEAHFFFLPGAIYDRARPYLPQAIIIAQQSTGIVLSMELIPPEENPYSSIVRKLISTINDTGLLPKELQVQHEYLAVALRPLAQALQFRISLKKHLPSLSEARRELKQAMRAGLLSRKETLKE